MEQAKNKKTNLPRLLAVLLLTAALLLSVGAAFARYQAAKEVPLPFAAGTETIKVTSDIWYPVQDGYENKITVFNQGAEEQSFSVETLLSLGIGDPENLSVRLTADGVTYVGTAEKLISGTTRQLAFGDGWQLRYDGEGENAEEVVFSLDPGEELTLTVSLMIAGSQLPDDARVMTRITAVR